MEAPRTPNADAIINMTAAIEGKIISERMRRIPSIITDKAKEHFVKNEIDRFEKFVLDPPKTQRDPFSAALLDMGYTD